MSRSGKKGSGKSSKSKDFLSKLEAELDQMQTFDESVKQRQPRSVSFNEQVFPRCFDKYQPSTQLDPVHHEELRDTASDIFAKYNDDAADEDDAEYDDAGLDFEEDDSDEEEDDAEYDTKEEQSEEDEMFAAMSPEEQLKMLMEPVDDADMEDNESDADEFTDSDLDLDDDEEDIDMEYGDEDNDQDDEEEETMARIPSKRQLLDLNEDEDEDHDQEELSTFEKQQARMAKRVADLEEQNLAEKEWHMSGEVSSKIRPINSLLEQDVDFEQICRAAPPITEEVTQTLEEMICQRIKDNAFDDVERRRTEEIVEMANKARKLPELDMEKSKKSLGQIYEEQAMASTSSAPTPIVGDVDPKTKAAHEEITNLFTKICRKIDALCHFKTGQRTSSLADMKITTSHK